MASDHDYWESMIPDGCVTCDNCGGMGTVPDFENWDDEFCPVCHGEGHITKGQAARRAKGFKISQEILAEALARNTTEQG